MYYTCPECHNKTLARIYENRFVGYGDPFVCEECGETFYADPKCDGSIEFKKNINGYEME